MDVFDPSNVLARPATYGPGGKVDPDAPAVTVTCIHDNTQLGVVYSFKETTTMWQVAETIRHQHKRPSGTVDVALFTSRWRPLGDAETLEGKKAMVVMYEMRDTRDHSGCTSKEFEVHLEMWGVDPKALTVVGTSCSTFAEVIDLAASQQPQHPLLRRSDFYVLVVGGKARPDITWDRVPDGCVTLREV
jgi:hypothetical protein